jgi:hypothetical protein
VAEGRGGKRSLCVKTVSAKPKAATFVFLITGPSDKKTPEKFMLY